MLSVRPVMLLSWATSANTSPPMTMLPRPPCWSTRRIQSVSQSEERWVVTVTDTLRDALAGTSSVQLAIVAVDWAATEEFAGCEDAALLGDFLGRFAALARSAHGRGQHLYCWMSL